MNVAVPRVSTSPVASSMRSSTVGWATPTVPSFHCPGLLAVAEALFSVIP